MHATIGILHRQELVCSSDGLFLVVAILGRDDHNMLLAQILLNAPYALTTWWLSETGHLVCFSILAARSFFGAHLSGRFDALLNCGATLGLLVITAPDVAWAWRDTVAAFIRR